MLVSEKFSAIFEHFFSTPFVFCSLLLFLLLCNFFFLGGGGGVLVVICDVNLC